MWQFGRRKKKNWNSKWSSKLLSTIIFFTSFEQSIIERLVLWYRIRCATVVPNNALSDRIWNINGWRESDKRAIHHRSTNKWTNETNENQTVAGHTRTSPHTLNRNEATTNIAWQFNNHRRTIVACVALSLQTHRLFIFHIYFRLIFAILLRRCTYLFIPILLLIAKFHPFMFSNILLFQLYFIIIYHFFFFHFVSFLCLSDSYCWHVRPVRTTAHHCSMPLSTNHIHDGRFVFCFFISLSVSSIT